jgi:hypothetical protein
MERELGAQPPFEDLQRGLGAQPFEDLQRAFVSGAKEELERFCYACDIPARTGIVERVARALSSDGAVDTRSFLRAAAATPEAVALLQDIDGACVSDSDLRLVFVLFMAGLLINLVLLCWLVCRLCRK